MSLHSKNTIYFFGDSFTYGDGCRPSFEYHATYPKSEDFLWPNLVASNLNMEVCNLGLPGLSNMGILRELTKSMSKFEQGDIVIIGKTDPYRFEIPYKHKRGFVNILANNSSFGTETQNNIMHQYEKHIHLPSYTLLDTRLGESIRGISNFLCKNDILTLIWKHGTDSDADIDIDLRPHKKINQITNGLIKDHHFAWEGHDSFSKKITSIIKKYKNGI